MSELGNFLRQAREEKKVSLDQLQEITKIRKRYLEAIEQGEYGILPGQFYARAFVKSYAEAIGLSAENVFEQFSADLPEVPKAPVVESLSKRKTKEVRATSPKIGKWISRVVFYSFIVLVVALFYLAALKYLEPSGNQTVENDPSTPNISSSGNIGKENPDATPNEQSQNQNSAQQKQQPSPEEKAVEENTVQEPTLTKVETTPKKTTFELTNAQKMELVLQATNGPIWYQLTDIKTNQTIDTAQLAKGTEKQWDVSSNKQVRFKFGNTKAFTLLVNGKPVDLSHVEKPLNIHYVEFLMK